MDRLRDTDWSDTEKSPEKFGPDPESRRSSRLESAQSGHSGTIAIDRQDQLVRIIARKTLKEFVDTLRGSGDQKTVKTSLDAWFHEAQAADWKRPVDVTRSYANASIVGDDRVVFNIKGNSYSLVVAIDYRRQIVFIKWLGSHTPYDKIDVKTVKYGD